MNGIKLAGMVLVGLAISLPASGDVISVDFDPITPGIQPNVSVTPGGIVTAYIVVTGSGGTIFDSVGVDVSFNDGGGAILTPLVPVAATSVGISFAAGPDGNKRKGKYTYKKVYKACSERGEVDSKTPPISPADKTMAQWQRIFDKKDYSEFGCADEWNTLSDQDVLDIYSYLYNYAADSPSPATCK